MYTNHAEPAAASVLCMPLLQGGGREREGGVRDKDQEGVRGGEDKRGEQGGEGEVVGVLELARKAGRPQFGPEDEEIVQSYFVWAAVALHSTHYCTTSKQQRILSESMITLTRYKTAFKLSFCFTIYFTISESNTLMPEISSQTDA